MWIGYIKPSIFRLHVIIGCANRAGAASMANMALAVPLFSCLTISRSGLYSQGGVAPTWWCSVDECSMCMQFKWPVAHVLLSWNFLRILTSHLPVSFFP